jgi:cysteine desulfurase
MRELLDRLGEPDGTGDPGRVHEEGRVARESVELAREQVAALAGVASSRVVFTSGATEAANTAVASFGPGSAIFCAPVEHSCVREASARTGRLVEVGVLPDGAIDLESLGSLLGRSAGRAPVLVNCQWANHEVATVQPVEAVAELCSKAGADLHVDAAAAFGHVPTDFGSLDAEYASVSAHKMGGPAGVGALILGRGVRLQPLLVGGSEERARRAGAENLLGIVGFGAAAAELLEEGRLAAESVVAAGWRSALVEIACAVGGISLLGPVDIDRSLPHIACLSIEGVLGEAVLLSLDRAGIAVHSGSACSSEILEPSPVLEAMGVDPDSSLRLSVGWSTTEEDVVAFARVFASAVAALRELGAAGPTPSARARPG